MLEIFNWLFAQYATYPIPLIILELTAVAFGVASVLLARKTNILVYPVGLISTLIFVYLLWEWQLFGDMLINFYYSVMSIYGWYNWSKNSTKSNKIAENNDSPKVAIERITVNDLPITLGLAGVTVAFVALVYYLRPVINNGFSFTGATLGLHLLTWVDFTDMVTTALFLIAMVLMARRKIENWLVWIVADAISVPLYFYKGLTFTALQYIAFTILAILAYSEWQRLYRLQSRRVQTVSTLSAADNL